MIDRKELKQEAREAIRSTRPSAVWVTLMVLAIMAVTQVLSLSVSGELEAYRTMAENAMNGTFALAETSGDIGMLPWLLTLALDLMTIVISVGYSLYCLRLSRRQDPGFGDVFDAFGVFFRAVWIGILRSVLVSLTSFIYAIPAGVMCLSMNPVWASLICLPLLAPMIVVAYAYRFAEFIMLDNPGLAGIQCMGLSRMATKGWKWEFFKLDLSFLGWYILCIVPFVILWVRPYVGVTVAGFYDKVMPGFLEELKNRPVPQTRFTGSRNMGWHVPGDNGDDSGGGDDPEDRG